MLLSKLGTFPSAGIKKNDITDIHAELYRIYRGIIGSDTFFNPDMVFSMLNSQREQSQNQKIYSPETYTSEMLEKFWSSKIINFVLNDQIGDSVLTAPLLISLSSLGKKLRIYGKNVAVIQRILDGVLGQKFDNSIEYIVFDFKADVVGIEADEFCINIHRIYQPEEPPRSQYLSLDWRMLPLFDADLYSFPDRLISLVETLFGYKHNSSTDTRTTSTHDDHHNVLFVPFSSLRDKEIPQKQWIDVLSHTKEQNPDADFFMVSNDKDRDVDVTKYSEIAETMEKLKFKVNVITLTLAELYDFLIKERPYVISSETGVGHLTSAVGLKTNILFSHGDYDFWSFDYDTVRTIPTVLAQYLRLSQHGLFDPAWKNTKLDPNFQPFLEKSVFDTSHIIRSLLK